MKDLVNTHDLRLPSWGPYSKKYVGISHIADQAQGFRFDLSVFPGIYRRRSYIPNVTWESDYHPWNANVDLTHFTHRHELIWKDHLYTDISFSKIDSNIRLIKCECVNNTNRPQNIVLHYMASINFPLRHSHAKEHLKICTVKMPKGGIWVDALDYKDLSYAVSRPTDHLVPDGLLRGEVRDHYFTQGSGIGQDFGKDIGDQVYYGLMIDHAFKDGIITLRYRMPKDCQTEIEVKGLSQETVFLEGTGEFATKTIKTGAIKPGRYPLQITSNRDQSIEIDGFAITEKQDEVSFEVLNWSYVPTISPGPVSNSLLLKYDDLDIYYGLYWDYDPFEVREFFHDELDYFLRHNTHHHVHSKFYGNHDGHFTNIYLRPIFLTPHSSKDVYGYVCHGSKGKVMEMLEEFSMNTYDQEEIYKSYQKNEPKEILPGGESYLFSQRILRTTALTNVVYPVYIKQSYIKHNTPGKWWDTLYTWDSGFIGLGLSEYSPERAIEVLNTYMTEPGDDQAAFIHHGSPVPVQHYLFFELWNKTQSREMLSFFYPRLKQYYEFLAGHHPGSHTRKLQSNLIQTWDYFYNSGGWDDYPPQVYVHKSRKHKNIAPISNTAHCIRIAKILKMTAIALGYEKDVELYDRDIFMFTSAIQNYSWDSESGYFGYVLHNDLGKPVNILKYENNVNYNQGLDGAYPLVAGICTKNQEKMILDHLQSEDKLWTKIGLSTVDQSAPYYREDGYWNGAVWFPHQWIYWKTMLDLGETDFARKIAFTALDLWKEEVNETYNSYEHFIIQSGRGAGWHQFGGLSSPILNWFGAYFIQGRLTCGFETWIEKKRFQNDCTSLEIELYSYGQKNKSSSIIVTMNPKESYQVNINGKNVIHKESIKGCLEITYLNKEFRKKNIIKIDPK